MLYSKLNRQRFAYFCTMDSLIYNMLYQVACLLRLWPLILQRLSLQLMLVLLSLKNQLECHTSLRLYENIHHQRDVSLFVQVYYVDILDCFKFVWRENNNRKFKGKLPCFRSSDYLKKLEKPSLFKKKIINLHFSQSFIRTPNLFINFVSIFSLHSLRPHTRSHPSNSPNRSNQNLLPRILPSNPTTQIWKQEINQPIVIKFSISIIMVLFTPVKFTLEIYNLLHSDNEQTLFAT